MRQEYTPQDHVALVAGAKKLERGYEILEHYEHTRPGWMIPLHGEGQIQALCSDATYRILVPGNGWGKTTCMAIDADLLMQRDDHWKPQCMPEPDRPTMAVWFCMKYPQWRIMQADVESLFTSGWAWHEQMKFYSWPNGSKLFIMSSDSTSESIQGIQLDAVYFDEHPDRKFWNEMMYRRRGKKKTRYMVAATMTLGITWFVKGIIQPWEERCKKMGLTNAQAIQQQPDPKTFVWNVGGIESNPSMSRADFDHYAEQMTLSEKERHVRLHGGYADFVGEPVFDLKALSRMEEKAQDGENGGIVFLPDEDSEQLDRIKERIAGGTINHRFQLEFDRNLFEWRLGLPLDGGRITIFEAPIAEQADNYVMGADFAAGLAGKDYDAAMVGRVLPSGQCRQVAEAVGQWGDIFFAEVLFALGIMYFEAFLVGERQFGLPCMRRLYDEMGYSYMFMQRHEAQAARRPSDTLGHHRAAGDTIIPYHRLAVARHDVILVSKDAIREHKRYQFRAKSKTAVIDEITQSSALTTGAPDGEFDDQVMSAAYMMHGAREKVHYIKPKRAYKPGTFGDVMNVDETLRGIREETDPYG